MIELRHLRHFIAAAEELNCRRAAERIHLDQTPLSRTVRYVSPAERHDGRDVAILAARHALYLKARERNPARWSGHTRDWSHVGVVTLNPERDSVNEEHFRSIDTQPLAA